MDEGILVLEESTLIRIEMCHLKKEVMTQNHVVLI